jgi:UDP:flavonoid glycosyltransferase YjiC (YdhE family)
MRIGLLTFGTRGDVQPFLALALGLQRAGHEVFLGAPRNFAPLAAEYGVPFRPMSLDTRALLERPDVKRAVESGSLWQFLRLRRRSFLHDVVNVDAWNMTADADAVVFRIGDPTAAHSIACKRGIPSIGLIYLPVEPSAELPPLGTGRARRRGPVYNRLMSELSCRIVWWLGTPANNRFRRDFLGLPKLPVFAAPPEYMGVGQPSLYAYSPVVLPKPSDWRRDAHVVGYLFLDEPPGWQPPADLCRYLAAGPKPLFVGFGSMPSADPQAKELVVLEAVRRTGVRAVIQGAWGGLRDGGALPDHIFSVGVVPYSWLLPRMAAVMHHGGMGTTADALRAGVPTIVVPHNFEQPYWAQRARELGVCPEPIPFRRLTADRLAAAIETVRDDRVMERRAVDVGAAIRAENGVRSAVELIEEHAARFAGNRSPSAQSPSKG